MATSPLSNEDVTYEYDRAIGKAAVMAQAKSARRGWLLRILPAAVLIIAVTLGGLQMATGIPVQAVFAGDPTDKYSSNSILMARMIVFTVLVTITYWLYKTYKSAGNTVSGFLLGENLARNPIMNTLAVNAHFQLGSAAQASTILKSNAESRQKILQDSMTSEGVTGSDFVSHPTAPPPMLPINPRHSSQLTQPQTHSSQLTQPQTNIDNPGVRGPYAPVGIAGLAGMSGAPRGPLGATRLNALG